MQFSATFDVIFALANFWLDLSKLVNSSFNYRYTVYFIIPL